MLRLVAAEPWVELFELERGATGETTGERWDIEIPQRYAELLAADEPAADSGADRFDWVRRAYLDRQ